MSGFRLTRALARRARLHAQGLPASGGGEPEELLRRYGPARTLGGVDVYLALLARSPGLALAEIDQAVEAGRIRVVPAVRGCIYLVAGADAPRWLRLAELLSEKRAARDAERAGIRPDELEELGEAVVGVLAREGALPPDGLRRALPDGAVRSLGEAGKKVGLSSTLPPALRRLEFEGRIERTLPEGRLDSERYHWRSVADPRRDERKLDELLPEVASTWLRAVAVGTLKEFAAWAGTSQRAARAALETIGVEDGEAEGIPGTVFRAADAAEAPEPEGTASLLPFEDNLLALAGGPAFWAGEEHHGIPVPTWGRGKPTNLGEAKHMTFRSIVADGRLVGFWEYDPDGGQVVTSLFDPPGASARREIVAAVERTAAFLRDGIGHGRSFSLDTDSKLRDRAGAIRARS